MKRILALLLMVLLLAGCAEAGGPEDTTLPPMTDLPTSFKGLGEKMPEMTVNTADGRALKLTEILKEKELVVLNFWFEDCPWCVKEFPVLELAYQNHREDVEILALNPADGAEDVKAFQDKYSLTFPMAACPRSWATECGVSAYPTSVFIDRDGVVCLIHVGAITTAYTWEKVFAAFTGDDYQRRIYTSVEQILR
jgi:peroxiredoxin